MENDDRENRLQLKSTSPTHTHTHARTQKGQRSPRRWVTCACEAGAGTVGVCGGWGVPRVQVPVAARPTVPPLAVGFFVATWSQEEEAALIKSRPSHFSPSPPFQSPRSLSAEERTGGER